MRNLIGKKVLLIASPYRGYYLKIAEAISKKGADVIVFSSEPKSNLYYKLLDSRFSNKAIVTWFCNFKESRVVENLFSSIKPKKFDYIVIIKGYGLNLEFLEKLRNSNLEAKMILYQWDSLKSFNYLDKINYFDSVYSFDYSDCENHSQINYLPLFYTDDYKKLALETHTEYKYQAFFLGVKHSMRSNILNEMAQFFKKNEIPYAFYLYTGLRTKILSKINGNHFTCINKPLTFSEFKETYKESKAIVDISSPNQTGLPIRIIEAIGANKKIITTNVNIMKEKFYQEDRIFIWRLDNQNNIKEFLVKPLSEFDSDSYSIHSFVNKLLS